MEIPFVDLKIQYRTNRKKIDAAIAEVIESSSFVGSEKIAEFEKSFAKLIGTKHAISCANGTDALEIAMEAAGISEGDEVLVPAYSFVATASAVKRVGAEPVFVDVHKDYYTINPDLIREAITSKTRAIIAVHLYGLPAPMPEINKLAKEFNLLVIEDCAQAIGANINRQQVGTFGDLSTISFYPSKNLGAYGDAGVILTQDDELAEKAKIISNLGQKAKHEHIQVGRNSRMDAIQAAVLLAKLPMNEEWTAKRRWVAREYNIKLADYGYKLQRIPDNYKHVYHLYVIQSENRDKLRDFLTSKGIMTQIHYPKPLNQFDFFKHSKPLKVADAMSGKLLSLPMYPELKKEQVEYIIKHLIEFSYMRH